MQYQREKDRRLYEQGLLAAENAHLAILKQGELVECMSSISKVLSLGLKVSQPQQLQKDAGYATCPNQKTKPQGVGSSDVGATNTEAHTSKSTDMT